MVHYTYLIIGGGMTAAAAVEGIREIDQQGSIGMFSAENNPPYDRPPLTKGLWKGKPIEKIWRKAEDQGVNYHLGEKVELLDPQNKRITNDQGEIYTYDKLLIATGGTPRKLPFGGDLIQYYRTVDDYQYLRHLTGQGRKFAVIGGGFIGSEITAALKMNREEVVMAFPELGIGGLVFPGDLSRFLNDYYREQGVDVLAGQLVTGVKPKDGRLALETKDSQEILVDHVVAGIGIVPNTELARNAGIDVSNGIIVDEYLCTNHADIYAAGDVAYFFNPTLNMRLRVEHEDNANTMGRVAGYNMAGQPTHYHHLPFFYSDLFDLGYEAVGDINSQLETVIDWQEPYQKGVIYYLKEGRVRGVLLWNVWDQVPAARELIAETGPFTVADLRGRLPRS